MIVVYLTVSRKDGTGRPFEKIVPIELKGKVKCLVR